MLDFNQKTCVDNCVGIHLTNGVHILPFLKFKRKDTGVQVQHMGEKSQSTSIASDLMQAIESKDEKGIMAALKAAFTEFDAEPHVEGPHESDSE